MKKIRMERIVTPEFRLSYPSIFEKTSFENSPERYEITMLFPKKPGIPGIKKAIQATIDAAWPDKETRPKLLAHPIRDGDHDFPSKEECKNMHVLKAWCSLNKPGVVDKHRNPIIDPEDIYAGCWCRATLIPFAYGPPKAPKSGVSLILQNIQKLKDDDSFNNRVAAEHDFDAIEESEETEQESMFD